MRICLLILSCEFRHFHYVSQNSPWSQIEPFPFFVPATFVTLGYCSVLHLKLENYTVAYVKQIWGKISSLVEIHSKNHPSITCFYLISFLVDFLLILIYFSSSLCLFVLLWADYIMSLWCLLTDEANEIILSSKLFIKKNWMWEFCPLFFLNTTKTVGIICKTNIRWFWNVKRQDRHRLWNLSSDMLVSCLDFFFFFLSSIS